MTKIGKPHCIYLFLLNPEDEHDVKVYFEDKHRRIDNEEIVDLVKDMIPQAKGNQLIQVASSMNEVTCNRVSYAAFVADSEKYKLDDLSFNPGFHTFKRKHIISDDTITGRIYLNSIKKKSGSWDGYYKERFRIRTTFVPWRGYKGDPRNHDDSGTNLGPPVPPP